MNARIWGIIGGVALVLALLSPLVLGNSKKIEQLFGTAEELYERSDYEGAIAKYKAALKESNKFGAKTERIDRDFSTLANLKIAQCYYELAEKTSDVRHYQSTLTHIRKVVLDAKIAKHQEELTYLWAETLYKIGDFDQAKSKFSWLIEKFPNSRWVPKVWYTIGEINYQQKNYEESLKTFQKFTEEFPHSEFKLEADRRVAEIENLVNNDHPPDPEDEPKAMYNAASDLQRQGKVHDAYQLYTDLITQHPDSEYVTHAYVGIAEIHLEAEDYVNARANYEKAIYNKTEDEAQKTEIYKKIQLTYLDDADGTKQTDPSDELFVKARLLRKEERFLEAAEIYEQLANSNLSTEDKVYALYWAGYCYYKAASTDSTLFPKSVDAFKKLITDHENSSYDIEAYYHLALAYTNWAEVSGGQSKWQLVIDTVERANTKYAGNDDTTVKGWLNRMQQLKKMALEKLPPPPDPLEEEAKKAIKTTEDAIDLAKEKNEKPQLIQKANERLEYAKQQMSRGDYKAAIRSAKKALKKLNPPPPPPKKKYVDQGYIYLRQGKLEEATKEARQALNLDSNCQTAHELLSEIKETHYGRGRTFYDEKQYDQAITEFKNVININIDPKFKEAHNLLGVVYIKQQRYTEAIKALKKAITIDEKFKEAYFNLALAYLELGDFEAATCAANAALAIDSNYERARMLIEITTNADTNSQ